MDAMAPDRYGSSLRPIRTLFSVGTAGGLTDAELLERFATREGEAAELAFAVLVERHGPMVLRVCRQVVRDGHAAEDAFQAAFLVLARKARSLRLRDSLAPWLQQVAWRTALHLRADIVRRRRHERRAAERAAKVVAGPESDELGESLHEELSRLPARYRLPLVLCYLEGLTSEQAARQLGWPTGTVRSRLARGRERLRDRLARRGLAPSAAALAAALAPRSAWSAVPPALVDAAARAAVLVNAGRAAAGAVPAVILSLSQGVLLDMAMTKWKIAGIALLVTGVLATGAMLPAQGTRSVPAVGASDDPNLSGDDVVGEPPATTAPAPRGRGRNVSQSDRLQAVERKLDRLKDVELKLDRVLDELGNTGPRGRARPGQFASTAANATGPQSAPSPAAAALANERRSEYVNVNVPLTEPAPNSPAAAAARGIDRRSATAPIRPPGSGGMATTTPVDVAAGLERRVASFEDRLAELERRLTSLERSLGPAPAGSPGLPGRRQ
jgi:RNA polymerase sigma factor (sigma-70 family)